MCFCLCSSATCARSLCFSPFFSFPALLCKAVPLLTARDVPEGSRAGGLQPRAAALGALPFLCLRRRTGPEGESSRGRGTAAPDLLPDSLGRVCAYRISILAVPLGINYAFRTRGYSNVKIVYLQLGELKTEAEERVAPLRHGRPPASLCSVGCGSPSAGRDGSSRLYLGISVLGRTRCSPALATSFCPIFLGRWVPTAWPRKRGGEGSAYFTLC